MFSSSPKLNNLQELAHVDMDRKEAKFDESNFVLSFQSILEQDEDAIEALKAADLHGVFEKHPDLINSTYSFFLDDTYHDSSILDLAVRYQSAEVVEFMLNKGANPDIKDDFSNKPIDAAIYSKSIEKIALLLIATLKRKTPTDNVILASQIVDELLNLDFGAFKYLRKNVCKALFYPNFFYNFNFDQNTLLTLLENELKAINHEEVVFVRKNAIGSGTYGRVYRGMMNSLPVAIKLCEKTDSNEENVTRYEANVHSRLKHKNIVNYICTLERDGYFGVVTSFCNNNTLSDLVIENDRGIINAHFVSLILQINDGMKYLHGEGYVHLDLKPRNVFLNIGNLGEINALIGDFGSIAKQGETRAYVVTSYDFCSPEAFDVTNPYQFKMDTWSFGVLLGVVETGKKSFADTNNKLFYQEKACKGELGYFGNVAMRDVVLNLMKWCCSLDPEYRPTDDQIEYYLRKNFNMISAHKIKIQWKNLHELNHKTINWALGYALVMSAASKVMKMKFNQHFSEVAYIEKSPFLRLRSIMEARQEYDELVCIVLDELLQLPLGYSSEHEEIIIAIDIFLRFMIMGKDYQSAIHKGNHCLNDALLCNHVGNELTMLLLNNGANPDETNSLKLTAFEFYVYLDSDTLFERMNPPLTSNQSKLMYFISNPDCNALPILEAAKMYGLFKNPEWINLKVNSPDKIDYRYLLDEAVGKQSARVVEFLIDQGADPELHNAWLDQPIDCAISMNDAYKAALLLVAAVKKKFPVNLNASASHLVRELIDATADHQMRIKIIKCLFSRSFPYRFGFTKEVFDVCFLNEIKAAFNKGIEFFDTCKLGSGTYASVHKGLVNDSAVAIKLCKPGASKAAKYENSIHIKLKHENIVKYICSMEIDNRLAIVMEYANTGTLQNFIQKKDMSSHIFPFAMQIISGVKYLHHENYVHLDLKPSNILLHKVGSNEIKVWIGDFGSMVREGLMLSRYIVTRRYCAPELFDVCQPPRFANDIFSLGGIFGEMDTKKSPWGVLKKKEDIGPKITRGERGDFDNTPLSKEVAPIVELCWKQNPDDRPTCVELENHLNKQIKFKL